MLSSSTILIHEKMRALSLTTGCDSTSRDRGNMAFDPVTAGIDLVKTFANKFLSDKMSEAEKADIEMKAEMFVASEARNENSSFRSFIIEYEGSAKDYANIPYIGSLVMLLRGLIRPVFTISVMWWDMKIVDAVLANKMTAGGTPQYFMAMIAGINIIVLIFWFGERSIQYIMPLLMPLIKTWTGVDLKSNGK